MTTVSRAVNGKHQDFRISEETRQRVLAAARELGYRASWTARALSEKKTHQIGLLFPYSIPELRGIYEDLMQRMTGVIEEAGYHLLFVPMRGRGWRDVLVNQRLDGCVVSQVTTPELSETILKTGLPGVFVNVEGDPRVAHVLPDDVGGVKLAVRHLVELGHRKIAFLRMGRASQANHFSLRDRQAGYVEAMRDAGLAEHALVADEPLEEFLGRVPLGPGGYTALVFYTHTEAVQVLPLLHRGGIRVPRDVSLVCFNDVFPMAFLVPAFTTVAVPGAAMGEAAARLLLEQIDSGAAHEPTRVVLPETLVVRESTAPPPVA